MGGLLIGGYVGYRYIDNKRYGEGTLIGAGVGALTMPIFIWQVLLYYSSITDPTPLPAYMEIRLITTSSAQYKRTKTRSIPSH